MFNGPLFPDYLSGAGYILPRVTWPCLFQVRMKLGMLLQFAEATFMRETEDMDLTEVQHYFEV